MLTIFAQPGRWSTISVDHSTGSSVSPHYSLTYPASILRCDVYLPGCSNVHSLRSLLPNFLCRFSGECKARVSHSSASINFVPTSLLSFPLSPSLFLCFPGDWSGDWHYGGPLGGPSISPPSPPLPSLPSLLLASLPPTEPRYGSEGSEEPLPDQGSLLQRLPVQHLVAGHRWVPCAYPEVLQLQRDAQGLRPWAEAALWRLCDWSCPPRGWWVLQARWVWGAKHSLQMLYYTVIVGLIHTVLDWWH